MNFWTLCESYLKPQSLSRTTKFRAEASLKRPLSEFQTSLFPLDESSGRMASILSRCAPMTEDDFESPKDRELFLKLQAFPQDRAYFEMLLEQDALFKKFRNTTVKDFLDSAEGKAWFKRAQRIKHKPAFCLEIPYYPTRQSSLRAEADLKRLLRRQPLLRYLDLKAMGFKNVQAILERFPSLNLHRQRYLKQLSSSLAQAK